MSFVFQFYAPMLILTAEQNDELPSFLKRLSIAERRRRAGKALDLINLTSRGEHTRDDRGIVLVQRTIPQVPSSGDVR